MTTRIRTSIVTLTLLVTTLGASTRAQAPAATKPDISGSWKLNLSKSAFDPAPQPSAQTEIITLAGDDLTIDYASVGDDGRQKYLYTLKLGGDETPIPKPAVNETPLVLLSAKASWKGASIVVATKITYQGGAGILTSTYTLSADGKTLTKSMLASIDMGDFEMRAVYDKA